MWTKIVIWLRNIIKMTSLSWFAHCLKISSSAPLNTLTWNENSKAPIASNQMYQLWSIGFSKFLLSIQPGGREPGHPLFPSLPTLGCNILLELTSLFLQINLAGRPICACAWLGGVLSGSQPNQVVSHELQTASQVQNKINRGYPYLNNPRVRKVSRFPFRLVFSF